jgi:hypothetical protein
MSDPIIFQIEAGEFGLKVVDKAAVGYLDAWQAPAGKAIDVVTLADYDTGSAAWTCQVTSAALVPSPNESTIEIPATMCSPAKTIPQPGETSFSVDVTFLQDPNIVAGLNRFLFENDTKEAYVYLGLDDGNPPRMIGRCRLIAGAIGGLMRSQLTADVSLPMSRKPDVEFGDTTSSQIVHGDGTLGPPPTVMAADATVVADEPEPAFAESV